MARNSPAMQARCCGCDFSSAPTARKPVVVAIGEREGDVVRLDGLRAFESLDMWSRWLGDAAGSACPMVGGFDLPFGLPRELVEAFGWPTAWRDCIAHYAAQPRPTLRERFAAFCAARPAGSKFAHRATDRPAGSSPSMKWVNPPVAWMLHAGVPRLIAAGWRFPAHEPEQGGDEDEGASRRAVALEAYPGLLARAIVGRQSYKSDDRALQGPERTAARRAIVQALVEGDHPLGLRLSVTSLVRRSLVADAQADRLDAVLCLLQAAWASQRPRYGLPPAIDPLEGWIASA